MADNEEQLASSLLKIANLLALDRIDGLGQQDQIAVLNAVGYSNAEAAELLGTTSGTVRATVNRLKRNKKNSTAK